MQQQAEVARPEMSLEETVSYQADLIARLNGRLDAYESTESQFLNKALEAKVLNQKQQLRQLNEAVWRRKEAIRKLRFERDELKQQVADLEEEIIALERVSED